jgi:8-oxo-dGTP diphosphatase
MGNENKEQTASGGVVVERSGEKGRRVLIVHRPRYDDWSWPKGKTKQSETIEETAVREVREETGLQCNILRKLGEARYPITSRKGAPLQKTVYYFLMEPISGHLTVTGDETDEAEWVSIEEARRRLSYDYDRLMLDMI